MSGVKKAETGTLGAENPSMAATRGLYKQRVLKPALCKFVGVTYPQAELSEVNIDVTKIRTYLRKYPEAKAKGYGMYLYGPPGHGKSWLMSAVCKELLRDRVKVRMRHISVLRTLLFDFRSPTYDARMAELVDVEVLAIDGLGSEDPSLIIQAYRARLLDLLQKRQAAGNVTFFTSGRSPEDESLASFYSSASFGDFIRLSTVHIAVAAEDYRKVVEQKKRDFLCDMGS